MNFEKHFSIPVDCTDVSESACDLMRHLICDRKRRFGRNGIDELKDHAFFKGIDWEHIRERYQSDDTSNFDIDQSSRNHEGPPLGPIFRGCQVACIGFTFTNNSPLNELGPAHFKMTLKNENKCSDKSSYLAETPKSQALCDTGSSTKSIALDECEISNSSETILDTKLEKRINETAVTEMIENLRTKCEAYEIQITELKNTLSSYHQSKHESITEDMALVPTEKVAGTHNLSSNDDHVSIINSLTKQVDSLSEKLKESETQNHLILANADSLKNELAEQHELRKKLQSEMEAFEEENESLVKRASDAQSAIKFWESEYNKVLSELTRLRGELASYREYVTQTDLEDVHNVVHKKETGPLENGIKNYNISTSSPSSSSSSSSNLVNGIQNSHPNNHPQDTDLQERLNESETKLKRVMENLIAVKNEAQNLKLAWQSEQKEWVKERELLEEKIRTAINQKTIALEDELTTLKANNAELESNIANWERHLFELNQWVDDERELKKNSIISQCV
ncbi:unnamed protein product [Heterobilharzia americana]|nr:unnamed protein product [Heterobilharzia americana]